MKILAVLFIILITAIACTTTIHYTPDEKIEVVYDSQLRMLDTNTFTITILCYKIVIQHILSPARTTAWYRVTVLQILSNQSSPILKIDMEPKTI